MRDIKVRGKRPSGEWVYGYLWINRSASRETSHIVDRFGDLYSVISETVGQFIGLQDKNDVEICEGDVLNSITYGYIGEVKYVPENAAFLVFWSDDKGRHTDYLNDGICKLVEIVGNIYV